MVSCTAANSALVQPQTSEVVLDVIGEKTEVKTFPEASSLHFPTTGNFIICISTKLYPLCLRSAARPSQHRQGVELLHCGLLLQSHLSGDNTENIIQPSEALTWHNSALSAVMLQ